MARSLLDDIALRLVDVAHLASSLMFRNHVVSTSSTKPSTVCGPEVRSGVRQPDDV